MIFLEVFCFKSIFRMNGQDFFLSDNQNCTFVYKSESIIDLLVIDDVRMDLRQL